MKKATIVYLAMMALFITLMTMHYFGIFSTAKPIPDPVETIDYTRYRININTATAEEIMIIPRIGQTVADNIVAYREENGPFLAYADLLNVKGIGTATLEIMLDYIIIE